VVVTKKGDTEDYFKDFAFYCEPDDLVSIREAVEKAFNAPFDLKFLNRIKDNYKWEDTAEQTFSGYKSII
jgi:glycosyltransferase involved in cell wall biosynthesis